MVLANRIVGFRHWGTTAFGPQALAMLAVFGDSLDEGLLQGRVRAEGATDAWIALRELAESSSREARSMGSMYGGTVDGGTVERYSSPPMPTP